MSEALATLVRKSRSSFYYSFLFPPRPKRDAIYAVYALCRAVDDVADDAGDMEAKAERLKGWREELDRCYAGRPTHPITRALRDCLSRYPIPKGYFEELIAGVEMDLTVTRYRPFADLTRYCYRVASVVGLICIEIFGYRREATKEYAINLGLALQLTNILRDLKTDGRRGRIYLPPEDRKNMAAAEIMGRIYRETLETIARKEFRVFEDRIALPRARKIRLALTTWARNRFTVQGSGLLVLERGSRVL